MKKQEIRIVTKIIRELSLFLMLHGHLAFRLDTRMDEKTMIFKLTVTDMKPATLEKIREKISRERELEVETYGWELLGDMDTQTELEIIGLLIDSLDVEQAGNVTTLILRRENKYQKD